MNIKRLCAVINLVNRKIMCDVHPEVRDALTSEGEDETGDERSGFK